MLKSTKFSYNWNNKLWCNVFTTIRKNSDYYNIGDTHDIMLYKKAGAAKMRPIPQPMGRAEIIEKYVFTLDKIPTWLCLLDTGYSKGETIKLLCRMHHVPDDQITTFQVCVIFFKRVKAFKISDAAMQGILDLCE